MAGGLRLRVRLSPALHPGAAAGSGLEAVWVCREPGLTVRQLLEQLLERYVPGARVPPDAVKLLWRSYALPGDSLVEEVLRDGEEVVVEPSAPATAATMDQGDAHQLSSMGEGQQRTHDGAQPSAPTATATTTNSDQKSDRLPSTMSCGSEDGGTKMTAAMDCQLGGTSAQAEHGLGQATSQPRQFTDPLLAGITASTSAGAQADVNATVTLPPPLLSLAVSQLTGSGCPSPRLGLQQLQQQSAVAQLAHLGAQGHGPAQVAVAQQYLGSAPPLQLDVMAGATVGATGFGGGGNGNSNTPLPSVTGLPAVQPLNLALPLFQPLNGMDSGGLGAAAAAELGAAAMMGLDSASFQLSQFLQQQGAALDLEPAMKRPRPPTLTNMAIGARMNEEMLASRTEHKRQRSVGGLPWQTQRLSWDGKLAASMAGAALSPRVDALYGSNLRPASSTPQPMGDMKIMPGRRSLPGGPLNGAVPSSSALAAMGATTTSAPQDWLGMGLAMMGKAQAAAAASAASAPRSGPASPGVRGSHGGSSPRTGPGARRGLEDLAMAAELLEQPGKPHGDNPGGGRQLQPQPPQISLGQGVNPLTFRPSPAATLQRWAVGAGGGATDMAAAAGMHGAAAPMDMAGFSAGDMSSHSYSYDSTGSASPRGFSRMRQSGGGAVPAKLPKAPKDLPLPKKAAATMQRTASNSPVVGSPRDGAMPPANDDQWNGLSAPSTSVWMRDGFTKKVAAITRERLQEVYHLNIEDAARELGIGMTKLKEHCRMLGIPRWPARKLKSMDKLMESLHERAANDATIDPQDIARVCKEIEVFKQQIYENPCLEVEDEIKRLRQSQFKKEYQQRQIKNLGSNGFIRVGHGPLPGGEGGSDEMDEAYDHDRPSDPARHMGGGADAMQVESLGVVGGTGVGPPMGP